MENIELSIRELTDDEVENVVGAYRNEQEVLAALSSLGYTLTSDDSGPGWTDDYGSDGSYFIHLNRDAHLWSGYSQNSSGGDSGGPGGS